jgi:hypothetical protein
VYGAIALTAAPRGEDLTARSAARVGTGLLVAAHHLAVAERIGPGPPP